MMTDLPIISLAIWVPILAGIAVLFTGDDRRACLARWMALAGSIAGFLATLPLYTEFNFADGGLQFQDRFSGIPAFNIH